ncbi:MAG: hypothetical protein F2954_03010 [Actinobacteria bacterium]|uniref:Unannotated protein n=1 Tax=freshwater metagenome TaxID=449393 RepID=A0A6J7VQ63_9ZZZZ|nr:hypothetical protein [Actinomycetota bacterium]
METRLNGVRNFSDFLAHKDSSLTEILNYLVRVLLPPLAIDSAIFFQGNNSGEFTQVAFSGLSVESKSELHSIYRLNEALPAAHVIKTGETLWLNISNKIRADFSAIKDYEKTANEKTIIIFPVWVESTPNAAIAIFSKKNLEQDSETEAFLHAISSIFSLYHYRKITVSQDEQNIDFSHPIKTFGATDQDLTQRQHVILRLISEERTNQSISEFLGYSESTIRQEIMRIFDKLGCSHRSEAATIYKSYAHNS